MRKDLVNDKYIEFFKKRRERICNIFFPAWLIILLMIVRWIHYKLVSVDIYWISVFVSIGYIIVAVFQLIRKNIKRSISLILVAVFLFGFSILSGEIEYRIYNLEEELYFSYLDYSRPYRTNYVDIYDVVKKAFLTDDGYTEEFAQCMAEIVFKRLNYNKYVEDLPRPLKIDFSLYQVSQTKETNSIRVDMIYTLIITDANGMRSGSMNSHISFFVKERENGWYIIAWYEKP